MTDAALSTPTAFAPRNPDWEAACLARAERQPVTRTLGIELTALAPGACELRLPFRADLTQQNGYFHAGIVALLADNAGGWAAYSLMPAGAEVLAVEFKLNLMAPAVGEVMIARGRVLRSGRTLTICSIDVFMETSGRETHVAVMQQTCMALVPGA